MKKFFKILDKFLVTIGIFVFIFLIWYYPIQRFLALKDFNKYITAQGINKSNIKSKKVVKDYKMDGYYIKVFYLDDPELRYEYSWYTGNCHENTFHIFLDISKKNVEVQLLGIQPKYPRLDKNHNYSLDLNKH